MSTVNLGENAPTSISSRLSSQVESVIQCKCAVAHVVQYLYMQAVAFNSHGIAD